MLSGLFGDGMHLEDGDGLGAEPPHGLVRKRVTTALDSKLEVIDFLPFLFFFSFLSGFQKPEGKPGFDTVLRQGGIGYHSTKCHGADTSSH